MEQAVRYQSWTFNSILLDWWPITLDFWDFCNFWEFWDACIGEGQTVIPGFSCYPENHSMWLGNFDLGFEYIHQFKYFWDFWDFWKFWDFWSWNAPPDDDVSTTLQHTYRHWESYSDSGHHKLHTLSNLTFWIRTIFEIFEIFGNFGNFEILECPEIRLSSSKIVSITSDIDLYGKEDRLQIGCVAKKLYN